MLRDESFQGFQHPSLAFGERFRKAGTVRSMGWVGDAYADAMCESFFATLECEGSTAGAFPWWPRHRVKRTRSSGTAAVLRASAARLLHQSRALLLSTDAVEETSSDTINPKNRSSVKAGSSTKGQNILCH